jgi:hypothetical protein
MFVSCRIILTHAYTGEASLQHLNGTGPHDLLSTAWSQEVRLMLLVCRLGDMRGVCSRQTASLDVGVRQQGRSRHHQCRGVYM